MIVLVAETLDVIGVLTMSELEPSKRKRPSKPKRLNKQQQLSRYRRPFPEISPEDQQKSPELARQAIKWLWDENEQQWFELKAKDRTIARQETVIRRKDSVISNLKEQTKIQGIVFERDVKAFKERERSLFGSSIVLTVLLILGGALASVGAGYIPIPVSTTFGALLVVAGVFIELLGVAILIFMRPRGGNK